MLSKLSGGRRVPVGAVAIMFAIFAVLLLFLGWRNEVVDRRSLARHEDAIRRVAVAQENLTTALIENCEVRNAAFVKYNTALQVRIESQVAAAAPENKAKVRRELEGLKFPIDDCARYRHR